MEARSSGHLDACVERRRGALLGRRVTGAERGCALRGEADSGGKVLTARKRKASEILIHDRSTKFLPPSLIFLIFKKIKVIQKDSYIRVSTSSNILIFRKV